LELKAPKKRERNGRQAATRGRFRVLPCCARGVALFRDERSTLCGSSPTRGGVPRLGGGEKQWRAPGVQNDLGTRTWGVPGERPKTQGYLPRYDPDGGGPELS